MATYKWEVESKEIDSTTKQCLVLKEDGTAVACITLDGLNTGLAQADGSSVSDLSEYIEVTHPTEGETSSKGVIKLKAAALATGGTEAKTITLTSEKYNLDLDGADASTHKLEGAAIPAAWTATREAGATTSTATYTAAGTAEYWTLSPNTDPKTIAFTPKVAGSTVAVISGLNGNLPSNLATLNGDNPPIVIAPAQSGKGTITIAASVLPTGSALPTAEGTTATVTLSSTGSDNYNLKLNEDVALFDATKGAATVNSIADDSGTKKATITRTQSAGWLEGTDGTASATLTYKPLTTKTIATVSGLNADLVEGTGANAGKFGTLTTADDPSTFVEAVTVNETTVILAKGALGTAAISIVDGTDGTAVETDAAYSNFKLALAEPNSDGTVGFDVITPYWDYTSGTTTATYKSGKREGWTLNTTGTDAGKITRTPQADATLATLTNLNATANAIKYDSTTKQITGITVDGNTITLAEDVLTHAENTEEQTDHATTLAQGTNVDGTTTSYTLALATGVATSAAKGTITLANHASVRSSVEVNQPLAEYWTLDGLKVSYKAADSQTLATIEGLNTNKTITGENPTVKLGDTSGSEITITVGKSALTDNNVTIKAAESLTVADDHTFKFALATGDEKPDAPATMPTLGTYRLGTIENGATGSTYEGKKILKVLGTFAAGYTLTNDAKTIDYTAPDNKTLATIGNLASGITDETLGTFISLDTANNLIKMKAGAIALTDGNTATLVNEEKVGDYTPAYKFAFWDVSSSDKVKRFDTVPTTFALSAPAVVSGAKEVDITGTQTAGYELNADQTEFIYRTAKTNTLATIHGLNNAETTTTTDSTATVKLGTTDETKKVVTLKLGALADGNVTITASDADAVKDFDKDYTLKLDDDVPEFGKTVSGEQLVLDKLTEGTVEIYGIKAKGWKAAEDGKSVVYTAATDTTQNTKGEIVATISGFKPVAIAEGKTAPETTDITLAKTTADASNGIPVHTNSLTLTVKWAALTDKSVTLNTEYDQYKLALDTTTPAAGTYAGSYAKASGTDVETYGFETVNYWEKVGTSAKYYSQKAKGWTLGKQKSTDTNNNQIVFTGAENGVLLATITNLSNKMTVGKSATKAADNQKYNVIGTGTYSATAADNTFVEGVKVMDSDSDGTNDTITLSKNVLGTVAGTSGASVITNATGNNFALALDNTSSDASGLKVPTTPNSEINVWELGSTSKYKKVEAEYWTLGTGNDAGKKITYTAQTSGTVLATITGLNSAIKEEDISVGTQTGTDAANSIVFTLNKNALANKGVTLTLPTTPTKYYKLALNTATLNASQKVDTPVLSNNKWELNSAKTTAYYKADVTAGYEAANDGMSIFYSTAATNKPLATVTGLNGGDLYVSQDGQHIGTKNEYDEISNALKFGDTAATAKQITLTGEVLGTSKVSVAGNNYTLAIGSDVLNSADDSATKSGNVWRVSGTTATYKNVNFANYTLETGAKSITYTPESDVTNGAIATIKGLKSGLVVGEDSTAATETAKTWVGVKQADGTVNKALAFNTTKATQIDLTSDALTTTNVTLTKDGTAPVTGGYTLALTTTGLAPTRDTAASLSFALVSGTTSSTTSTVNLKGTMKAGWTLETTGNDANKKITYSKADTNHTFATITGLKKDLKSANISGTSAGIKVTDVDTAAPKISLDMTVLDTAQVALDDNGINSGFSFTLDSGVNAVNNNVIQIWEVSGTTATFKKVNEAYYTRGKKTVNNSAEKENVTVLFYKRTDVNGGIIATISNLKSGLKVEDDKIAGIDLGTDGKTFKISGDVLDKKNSTITKGAAIESATVKTTGGGTQTVAYEFAIDADLNTVDSKRYWKVSGTTASYVYDTTEGYTISERDGNTQTITYSAEKTGDKATVVAKIEGLKSGLSESALKSGITVGTVATETLTGGGTKEVFTADSENGNIFKVSASVLDTDRSKKAKISSTTLTGDKVPQFRLADDVTVSQTGQNAWSIDSTSGDATLKSNFTTTGYNITGTGSAEITYTKAAFASGAAVLATVKGLKSGTTVNEDTGQITGVVLGGMEEDEIELDTDSNGDGVKDKQTVQVFKASNSGTLIQLSKAVLGTDAEKPVTLKNAESQTYTFALGDNVDTPVYSKKWSYGSGTATLVEGLTAGYAIDTDTTELAKDTVDHTVSYYAKDSLTTKIAGIKSGTISADKSTFDGISFVTQTVEQLRSAQQGAGDVAESQTVVVAIPKTGTFQIADSLLQNKTITLTNGNKNATYGVTLATASKIEPPATPVWNKTDSQTTATYTETIAKNNYSQTSDTKVTYSDKDIVNTLATVKGLKKEIVPDENGAIEGIVVASTEDTLDGYTLDEYKGKYKAITLSKNVLGSSEITLTTDKNYYLALANDSTIAVHTADPYFTYNKSKGTATLNGGKTEGWSAPTEEKTISTTAPNGTTTTSKVTARVDLKKLAYTAAVPEPIATVSGLKVNKDNIVEGIEFEKGTWSNAPTTSAKNTGTITLSGSALDKKDVTVTVSSDLQGKCDLTFALEGDIFEPADEDRVWTADGKGTAKYQYTTTEGYTLDDKSTTLGYSKEKLTVLATITGLDKSVKTLAEDGKKIGTAAEIPGILVSSEPEKTTTGTGANATTKLTTAGVIELQEDSILGNKVKLTSEDYVFALNEDIKSQKFDPEWYLSGTTARYKAGMTAGYDLDDETGGERKTVTKVARTPDKDADAQITIKGLKKGVTLANINDNGIIVNPDNTITLGEAVLGTTDITLENGVQTPASGSTKEVRYAYSFDLSTITQPETQEAEWTLKSGTATLKQKTTAGFTPNTDNTTLTYSKEVTPVVATVKGLDTKLKLTVDGQIAAEDQVVATTETVNKKKVTTYSLKTNADTGTVVGNPAVTFNDNVITLAKDALTTKNVTLINGKDNKGVATAYQLNLGSGITTSEGTATEWVVSGSTANYKNYSPIYYEMETGNTSIKYHAASKGTIYAAVTGLDKKTTTADDLNEAWSGNQNGGVLTLNAKQLGTSTVKITSKVKGKDTFTLALSASETEDEKVKLSTVTGKSWSKANNSGKATLTGTLTDGYTLAFGGKSITYLSKNKTNQQLATVTGLAKGASVSDVDGVITLAKSQLTNKNVTVTTTKGDTDYTLSLGDDATALAPTFAASGDEKLPLDKEGNPTDPQVWENPKGTATLKGYVTEEGWTLAESNKAITYTKANAGTKNVALKDEDGKTMKDEKGKAITAPYYKASANLVTVTNITKGDTPTISDKTVTVAGNDVASGKNNVTANGIGVFTVKFDDKYTNKTATGSAVSDKLKIEGTGVSVVGGKGDDHIDLSGSKNTIVYSNGEGNDVIANFDTLKDKLQVKSGAVAVAKSNSDIIVKVGNGSIKLTGIADAVGNTLTVLDKKGNEVEYWVQGSAVSSGGSLLADDNYSTDPAQLSSIVEPATTGITPYDIDSGLGLTKDNITPSVTYSGTDKK